MIDHLSAKAAESHIKYMLDQIQGDRKDFGGLTTFMLDSYEVDPANDWTPDFVEQFKQLFGYDPLPYLPVLAGVAVGSPEIAKRFEHDYRKAVGEMIYRNHFVREKEILNARGLKLLAEAGYPDGRVLERHAVLGDQRGCQRRAYLRELSGER
jgi:hypothetical protein